MSNLLKRGSTISKEERIIDYNEIIRTKLQSIAEMAQSETVDTDGFVNGLTAEVVEQLTDDADSEALAAMEPEPADLAQVNEEAQQIIASANEQAEAIINDANAQAGEIINQAAEQGYQEGMNNAVHEIEQTKRQLEDEYAQRVSELEDEYAKKMQGIEPQLVDVIAEVFKAVTASDAIDNQDVIMHLINTAMSGADRNLEYIIKVSSADYDYVSANQGKISCNVNKGIDIEVQEDVSLEKNQCIIETDNSIIDCSLDVEMEALVKKIKLLSCMR